MKKTLLLAGAAMVVMAGSANAMDQGLELGLEGYASAYGVYVSQDDEGTAGRSEFELKKEMQLDFTGEVMLDNGMTVGATIEMDMNENDNIATATADDDVEESYIYMKGGFGKVIAGQEYNAAYLMQVAAPAVDAEIDGMDPTYDVVSKGNIEASTAYAMYGDGDGDTAGADKLTYITPKWGGFQAAASYTPDVNVEGSTGELADDSSEAYSLAARYAVEDVLGADWVFGAGHNMQKADGTVEDSEEYNVGVKAMVDAWDFGVAYYHSEEDDISADVDTYALGVNYETGAFTYGASYLYSEAEDGVADEDEVSRYMAGVNYAYGPGMSLNGSVSYNDYQDGDTPAGDNEATVVAIGTVINF